jgi:hypothetical protein
MRPLMLSPDLGLRLCLRGPLSAVIGTCVNSYSCCIGHVLLAGHWRWDSPIGPRMSNPLDDPLNSPEGEAGPQRTVFGGATPFTKPVKHCLNGVWHYRTASCRPAPMGPNRCTCLRDTPGGPCGIRRQRVGALYACNTGFLAKLTYLSG